jgi:hypothetical protein
VVPGKAMLDRTYRAFAREKIARPEVEALIRRLNTQPVIIPPDLGARVRDHLDLNPAETWDKAVRKIVGIEDLDEDEEG